LKPEYRWLLILEYLLVFLFLPLIPPLLPLAFFPFQFHFFWLKSASIVVSLSMTMSLKFYRRRFFSIQVLQLLTLLLFSGLAATQTRFLIDFIWFLFLKAFAFAL
jgi:hypothetical protein